MCQIWASAEEGLALYSWDTHIHVFTNTSAPTRGSHIPFWPMGTTHEREHRTYFPLKPGSCLKYGSPSLHHFLSLSSHTLSITASVNLSPSLVYLLSQLRKSRDYQKNNPRTRGLLLPASAWKPAILPPPFSFRPILFPFLGRGWGCNDGR